jgi:hypothetical protein
MTQEPIKKSHKRQGRPWNQVRAEERAKHFFLIYESLGTSRTLKRLWGLLRGIGVKTSLKRLEEYSRKYHWQSQILERAARKESATFQNIQEVVDKMNQGHAELFQDLGALARAGVAQKKAEIDKKVAAGLPPTLDMDYSAMARLAEIYQRGERLARGLATSKAEIIVEVLPPLVKDIFAVFMSVNVITNDPPELIKQRQSEFLARGDQVLMQYYTMNQKLEH